MQDIRAKATYDAYADLLLNEQQVSRHKTYKMKITIIYVLTKETISTS
jgi:hypothetical protein